MNSPFAPGSPGVGVVPLITWSGVATTLYVDVNLNGKASLPPFQEDHDGDGAAETREVRARVRREARARDFMLSYCW